MEFNLDTVKLLVFVGGFVVFFGLESLFPARRWSGSRLHRLGFHVGLAVLNTFTIRILAFVPFLLWSVKVEEEGWGLSRWLGLHGWVELATSLIVLDFFDYLWHRANHRVRFLWRFHKGHHADTAMDVTTSLRFHPGELLLSFVAKGSWILLWGPSVMAWFLFEVLVSLCAQFHHSNLDLPNGVERWLSRLIVTPRFHAAHHAVDQHFGNANFSTILSVWDHLFRSYAHPADGGATTRAEGSLGLPEGRDTAFSLRGWVEEPFRHRNLGLADRPGG
jgi:sterol desaturase/sphingolipid hydroxylase (fatty acid hydroxylase superfamily)